MTTATWIILIALWISFGLGLSIWAIYDTRYRKNFNILGIFKTMLVVPLLVLGSVFEIIGAKIWVWNEYMDQHPWRILVRNPFYRDIPSKFRIDV